MSSMNNKLLILGLLLSLLAFLLFGKSVYMPVVCKLSDVQSVDDDVKEISNSTYHRLEMKLTSIGFYEFPDSLTLVGFKEEQLLEVYAHKDGEALLISQYPFTAMSGELGPKLQRGDLQIPEGIYDVEYLNPNSAYYLSMKISYPNAFDRSKTIFSDVEHMGDNIFIHGKDVTIGCIPIGDEAIEELFVLVENAGLKSVVVIISPRDFRINTEYPMIESIDWEVELYDRIAEELDKISLDVLQ